jgi:pimeloyl-ACP methyl ester carboxylesterase
MGVVEANGIRLNMMRVPATGPAGAPVVMLHGIVVDNLSSLFYTLAHPVSSGNDVVLYDLRGHGRSERPATGYAMADHVADLAGLLQASGIDEPVILLGNSFGGGVAVAFALAHPERVAGLILIEAHVPVPGSAPAMAAMLRRIGELARQGLALEPQLRKERRVTAENLPALRRVGLRDDQIDFVTLWIETAPSRKVLTMARTADALVNATSLVADVLADPPLSDADLTGVDCPVLLLYGEHSDIVDRGRQLAAVLPRAELAVLAGCDHSVLMAGADRLRDHILPWLADRRGERGAAERGAAERGAVQVHAGAGVSERGAGAGSSMGAGIGAVASVGAGVGGHVSVPGDPGLDCRDGGS